VGGTPAFAIDARVRAVDGSYRWCRCIGHRLDDAPAQHGLVLLVDVHDALRHASAGSPGGALADGTVGTGSRGQRTGAAAATPQGARPSVALAALAHALRNPIQALRHALYALHLPELPEEERQRMLLVQTRQVDELSRVIEAWLAQQAAGDAREPRGAATTVEALVHALLRVSPGEGLPGHRVSVRMEEPSLVLAADSGALVHEVGARWRDAVRRHGGASRSVLSVRRAGDEVVIELALAPGDGRLAPNGTRARPAQAGTRRARARLVHRAAVRLGPALP
jgi:hypothetical protein